MPKLVVKQLQRSHKFMLNKLIEKVKEIAQTAGAEILAVYGNKGGLEIIHKKDKSPLTIADQRSNQLICESLKRLTPKIPIISEENKEIPYEERKSFEQVWLIDPLDGTKEFIKRNGDFTVNIALIEQNKVVLGVVYVPVSKELFWAVKGQGAYFYAREKVEKLSASIFSMQDKGLNVVCSQSHLNRDTSEFISRLNQANAVSKGSSLKFLILAQGRAHIYPRLAPTMEWDTAAAQIILEESGGKVIETSCEQPLSYNKKNLLNPHFVAYANVQS